MRRLMKRLEKMMVAITFAEAGEYETVKEILREEETASEAPLAEERADIAAEPEAG